MDQRLIYKIGEENGKRRGKSEKKTGKKEKKCFFLECRAVGNGENIKKLIKKMQKEEKDDKEQCQPLAQRLIYKFIQNRRNKKTMKKKKEK